jgi:hypothetical protein
MSKKSAQIWKHISKKTGAKCIEFIYIFFVVPSDFHIVFCFFFNSNVLDYSKQIPPASSFACRFFLGDHFEIMQRISAKPPK